MNFSAKEQLAGINSVEFYLLSETSQWPGFVTDENSGAIVIIPKPNNLEVDGTIVPDSITVDDRPRQDASGEVWPINISSTYQYRGLSIEKLLSVYSGQPGIAITCFNDGSRKLYGSNQVPIYMSWSNIYGDTIEDSAGIKITVSGTMNHRPVFIN